MSSTPFTDIGLTADQISSNYTYSQIEKVHVNAVNSIYFDEVKDVVVIPVSGNTFERVANDDLTLIGTELTQTLSNNVVMLGHSMSALNSDNVVVIGGSPGGGVQGVTGSSNVISIGFENAVGSANAAPNNINIGDTSAITGGSNNIVIGQQPAHGGLLDNTIVITHRPLIVGITPTARGSVILGGDGNPSVLPKFQLLSPAMVGLINQASDDDYDPDDAAAAALTNGFMRMKYQGVNIKIPIMLDTDVAIPPPPP
jgi:hypothetical protein